MLLKTRLRALLATLALVAVVGAVVVVREEQADLDGFLELERKERGQTLGQLFDLSNQARDTWVIDNTAWDEAVTYARGGGADHAWAEIIYGDILPLLQADALYFFDREQRLLHTVSAAGADAAALAPPLSDLFGDRRIISYHRWVGDTLVAVASATLHPSDDIAHQTTPEGVLAVVKRWDAPALVALGKSLGVELSIGRPGSPLPDPGPGRMVVEAPLRGRNAETVALLRGVQTSPVQGGFAEQHLRVKALETAAVCGAVAVLVVLLNVWVLSPLGRLERSLIHRDPESLRALQSQPDELGALARLIGEHFGQAARMEAEINERIAAEASVVRALREKEVLLKEVHHRVKNNLQVVSSLLSLQANQIDEPEARQAVQESMLRVRSMALVHQQLYGGADLAGLDFAAHARKLVSSLRATFAPDVRVDLAVEGSARLGIDTAVPMGLLLNELLTNAFKYGISADRAAGAWDIRLEIVATDAALCVTVRDRGPGLPDGFSLTERRTLGLRLVSALLGQIRATLEAHTDGGAVFKVCLPIAPPAQPLDEPR
jgi:two-component sensor histidine kinase